MPEHAWELADLCALSPADASQPDLDLIAIYARLAGTDFQVRLDLLDLARDAQFDLYLALDFTQGGTRDLPFRNQTEIVWDLLLFMPHAGPPQAFSPPERSGNDLLPRQDIIPRLARYPWLDSLVISINSRSIPTIAKGIAIEAYIINPDSTSIADRLGPARTDSPTPGQANLLLAFWNTFPAYTPAQALRRWDGAHTGPFGEHHGLHVLLHNVRRYQVPITLLDLKSPASLSAVDLVGGIPLVQNLVNQGLLILPDVVNGSPSFAIFPDMLPHWAISQAIQDSRTVAKIFGLPASRFLYTPNFIEDLPNDYPIIFTPMADSLISRWKNSRLIRIPVKSSIQAATADGLATELRQILLASAIQNSYNPNLNELMVVGGSLPDSAFGDPQASQATLLYLAAHPWIRVLRATDFFALPQNISIDVPLDQPGVPTPEPDPQFSTILADLTRPDQNHLIETYAWQATMALYAPLPPETPELIDLRGIYSGQIGIFELVAGWAKSPQAIQECSEDPDLDGVSECIYATKDSIAIFDPVGGRLLALYSSVDGQVHQIIGPTHQFLIGQADPSSWDLAAGETADPGVIPGAFIDGLPPWDIYLTQFSAKGLTLSTPQGDLVKTFTLNENGLNVIYELDSPASINIPLVLDPWQRFSPGWGARYQYKQIGDGLSWELNGGPRLIVRSSAPASLEPFAASQADLQRPEDPNFEYPPGHYLVFPIALVRINAIEDFQVEISISNNEVVTDKILPINNLLQSTDP
jgi:hypothetical protein